jgi:hypothetical protein
VNESIVKKNKLQQEKDTTKGLGRRRKMTVQDEEQLLYHYYLLSIDLLRTVRFPGGLIFDFLILLFVGSEESENPTLHTGIQEVEEVQCCLYRSIIWMDGYLVRGTVTARTVGVHRINLQL